MGWTQTQMQLMRHVLHCRGVVCLPQHSVAPPCLQADIESYCAEAKTKLRGTASVLKCLVENYRQLAEQCQTEMSRAVRLALWDYKPGAALTTACDADVDAQCPRVRGVGEVSTRAGFKVQCEHGVGRLNQLHGAGHGPCESRPWRGRDGR